MKKILSLILALTLVGCGVNRPNLATVKPNGLEKTVQSLKIPGEVERYVSPNSDKLVYLIPDYHAVTKNKEYPQNRIYQKFVADLMIYLVSKKNVKMIGIEGCYQEFDGTASNIMLLDQEDINEEINHLISRRAPTIFEIVDPNHFYTYGIDDKELHDKVEGIFSELSINDSLLSMITSRRAKKDLEKEIKENYVKLNENTKQRSILPIENLIKEMTSKGHNKAMVPFGASHMSYMKDELTKQNTSWIYIKPDKFIEEYYGKDPKWKRE